MNILCKTKNPIMLWSNPIYWSSGQEGSRSRLWSEEVNCMLLYRKGTSAFPSRKTGILSLSRKQWCHICSLQRLGEIWGLRAGWGREGINPDVPIPCVKVPFFFNQCLVLVGSLTFLETKLLCQIPAAASQLSQPSTIGDYTSLHATREFSPTFTVNL